MYQDRARSLLTLLYDRLRQTDSANAASVCLHALVGVAYV